MKFGIIGTNFISDWFAKTGKRLPDYQLVAVCGTSTKKAQEFAQKYGDGIFATDDYTKLPESGIDAVYIGAPNEMHCTMTKFFLGAGIPVLCEKPLAPTFTEVQEMIALSKSKGVTLFEGIVPLYTDSFGALRQKLTEIGKVHNALFTFCQYSSRYDSFRQGTVLNAFDPKKRGGSLRDIGIYPLYQAMALFEKPKKVTAVGNVLSTGVDGSGIVLLCYEDKQVAIMHSKTTFSTFGSEIQGEDGTLVFRGGSNVLELNLHRKSGETERICTMAYEDKMLYELQEFIDCVAMGKLCSEKAPHELALQVYQVVDEIIEQVGAY